MQSLKATKAQGRLRLPTASTSSYGRDSARQGVANNVESVAEAIEGMQNLGYPSVPTYNQPSQSIYSQYAQQPMYSTPSLSPSTPNPFASRSIPNFQAPDLMPRYSSNPSSTRGPPMNSSMSVADLRSAAGRGSYSGSSSSR